MPINSENGALWIAGLGGGPGGVYRDPRLNFPPLLSFSCFALFAEGEKPIVQRSGEKLLTIVVSRVPTLTFLTARSKRLADESGFTGKKKKLSVFVSF